MRLAIQLVALGFAILILLSVAMSVLAIAVPSAVRAFEPPRPNVGVFDDVSAKLNHQGAVNGIFGGVSLMFTFGLLLIVLFIGALLRRQPITQSRQVRGQMEVEEARIMQEIYRSLGKMEGRIEALETLLLERPRTGEYSEPFGRGTHRP